MPKPSFLQSFLGRPSRSYAENLRTRADDDIFYGHIHQHEQPYGSLSGLSSLADLPGPSRRAHSTVSYSGPSRRYSHNTNRPVSPSYASDVGTSSRSHRHTGVKSALFDGDIPPLPPQPPHVHFNPPPPQQDWTDRRARTISMPPSVPEHSLQTYRDPSHQEQPRRSRPQSLQHNDVELHAPQPIHSPPKRRQPLSPVQEAPALIPSLPKTQPVNPAPSRPPLAPVQSDVRQMPRPGAANGWESSQSNNSSLDSTPESDIVSPQASLVARAAPRPVVEIAEKEKQMSPVAPVEQMSPVVPEKQVSPVSPEKPLSSIAEAPVEVAEKQLSPVIPKTQASPAVPEKALPTIANTPIAPARRRSDDDTTSEYDVYYTPRSSVYHEAADDAEDEDDAETPSATVVGLPIFAVQPPTPASIGGVIESPPVGGDRMDYLSPQHASRPLSRSEDEEDEELEDEDDSSTEGETEDEAPRNGQADAMKPAPPLASTGSSQARSVEPAAPSAPSLVSTHPPVTPQHSAEARDARSRRRVTLVEPDSESESEPEPRRGYYSGSESESESESEYDSEPEPQPVREREAEPQQVRGPTQAPRPAAAPAPRAAVTSPKPKMPEQPAFQVEILPPKEDSRPTRPKLRKTVSAGGKVHGASMTIVAASTSSANLAAPDRPLSRSGSKRAISSAASSTSRSRSNSLRSSVLSPTPDSRHSRPSSRASSVQSSSVPSSIAPSQGVRPTKTTTAKKRMSQPVLRAAASTVPDRPASMMAPPPMSPQSAGRMKIATDDYSLSRGKTTKPIKTSKAKSSRSEGVASPPMSPPMSPMSREKHLPPIPSKSQSEINFPSSAYTHTRQSSAFSGSPHAPASEVSGSSMRSNGVRGAGYGKGGWAAASAEPAVMYMPAPGSGDGWSAFQPLPPRSRATPLPGSGRSALPGSSQSSTYDLDRSRSPTDSAASSILGLGASASVDGFVYKPTPGAHAHAHAHRNGHSPGSSINGRYNSSGSPPRVMSPLASGHNTPQQSRSPSTPASPVEAEQGSNGGSVKSELSEDDISIDEEPLSRSYRPAAVPAPAPVHVPVSESAHSEYASQASYDYASENPTSRATSRATSQSTSPSKMYDGAGRERRWAPPNYDPYAHAPPAKVNISNPAYLNAPGSRASMPARPRPTDMSGRSSPDSEYSQPTPRIPTPLQVPQTSFPGLSLSPPPSVAHMPFPGQPISPAESYYSDSRPMSPAGSSSYHSMGRSLSPVGSSSYQSFGRTMSPPPSSSPYDMAARAHAERMGLSRPSTLNPDILTVLPEMSEDASNQLYLPTSKQRHRLSSSTSEAGGVRRSTSLWGKTKYSRSESGGAYSRPSSESGRYSASEIGHQAKSDVGEGRSGRPRISLDDAPPRPKSRGGSTVGDMAMISEGNDYHNEHDQWGGYTALFMPHGGVQKSSDPRKEASAINPRIVGLPETSMAAITLSSALHMYIKRDDAPTPLHLRHTLPPPVEFAGYVKPPDHLASHQVMVQVYACAVDWVDVAEVDRKERHDVGKWIPGRSFVGRCLATGVDEKDIIRGDLVIGLMSIKKSGALSEFLVVDRRHCARVNPQTALSVAELSALPSQGIASHRAVRESMMSRGKQALIMDAHEGIPALMCQELTRKGVAVTAVIPGGAGHAEAQAACMQHGARGVLTGSPVNVLQTLDARLFDMVVDTHGSAGVYEAAKRTLIDGGRLVSLVESRPPSSPTVTHSRSFRSLKGVFSSRKDKGEKRIIYNYVHPAGAGEPEVDSSGMDYRDVMEESVIGVLRPPVNVMVPLERGAEVFRSPRMLDRVHIAVVRLVN